MNSLTRFEFGLRVVVILLAVSGWAAFAGTYVRLADTEKRLAQAAEANAVSERQNAELGLNFEKMLHAQQNLQRLQEIRLKELQAKVENYEVRLRQLGIQQ